jgi:hypothetical protein
VPAVQKVREASNRTECSNNLKQISLAALNFESTYKRLPPGGLVSPNSRNVNPAYVSAPPYGGPYTGVLAFLLPYVEQDNVYKQLDPGLFQYNTTTGAWAYNTAPFDFMSGVPAAFQNGTGYPHAADANIKTYVCPSDNAQFTALVTYPSGGVVDAYWTESGSIWIDYVADYPNFGHEMGAANYIGCAGYLGPWVTQYTGPYYQNSRTKIAEIVDGTSNTIGFGETLAGASPPSARDFRLSWMGAGSMPSAWGLANTTSGWYQFSSNHTAVVQFGFCDGSVRSIVKGAPFTPFLYASAMRDGQVVDFTALGQ